MLRISLFLFLVRLLGGCQNQQRLDQNSDEYKIQTQAFIHWYRDFQHLDSTMVLQDSVAPTTSFGFDSVAFVLDTADVAPQERKEFITSTVRPPFAVWTLDLASKFKLIKTDTLNIIFNGDLFEGWNYIYKNYGRAIYSFGCPFFLWNYTLCLFYSGSSCGDLCGGGALAMYRKEGDHWFFVRDFGRWVS